MLINSMMKWIYNGHIWRFNFHGLSLASVFIDKTGDWTYRLRLTPDSGKYYHTLYLAQCAAEEELIRKIQAAEGKTSQEMMG